MYGVSKYKPGLLQELSWKWCGSCCKGAHNSGAGGVRWSWGRRGKYWGNAHKLLEPGETFKILLQAFSNHKKEMGLVWEWLAYMTSLVQVDLGLEPWVRGPQGAVWFLTISTAFLTLDKNTNDMRPVLRTLSVPFLSWRLCEAQISQGWHLGNSLGR